MNWEWLFSIMPYIIAFLTNFTIAILVYILTGKRQKKQYIIDKVKDQYEPLFDEIKRRSKRLDNFQEKPYELPYTFRVLNEVIGGALSGFMQAHHEDLFSSVDSFQKNIFPKYGELALLRVNSEGIASYLITTIGPDNILADLLNRRYIQASNKIDVCIQDRRFHISDKYTVESRRLIREQEKNIDEISQKLIEMAKPEIENLLKYYRELREENDREVKEKLLPLLQKYVNNPV